VDGVGAAGSEAEVGGGAKICGTIVTLAVSTVLGLAEEGAGLLIAMSLWNAVREKHIVPFASRSQRPLGRVASGVKHVRKGYTGELQKDFQRENIIEVLRTEDSFCIRHLT
jgi:hypothetical protein